MTRQLELVVQGVLGTTPVVSRTPSGRAYCRFRLATTPTFRTNRDAIVLNDTTIGTVWLPECSAGSTVHQTLGAGHGSQVTVTHAAEVLR